MSESHDSALEAQEYNPLSRQNLAVSVASQLVSQPLYPLEDIEAIPLRGAGLYALYYRGNNPTYRKLVECNQRIDEKSKDRHKNYHPIYVGRALPSKSSTGQNKGGYDELKSRLIDHRDSVRAALNLEEDQFWFRSLPVADLFIALGEDLLLKVYQPVWNKIVRGFGNHDPGVLGREAQRLSVWDSLHTGRDFSYVRKQDLDENKKKVGPIYFDFDASGAKKPKPPNKPIEKLEQAVDRHLNVLRCEGLSIEELAAEGLLPKVSKKLAFPEEAAP